MKSILIMLALIVLSVQGLYSQSRPDAHAPIGVMGDHMHQKGEIMFSYRFMTMKMSDNRIGTDDVSSEEIATTVSNRFFGMPMMPPTLRVVPLDMTMNMHMVGVMYAPSDKITLMAMFNYLSSSMDHVTYQGGVGNAELGGFTTESSGLGDTRFTVMFKINETVHFNLGVSMPTGSIEEEDQVLTPMNMQPTLRLPYPMQIGSGTWDLLPTATYFKKQDNVSYGAQISGVIRMGENENNFTYGNRVDLTAWGSYLLIDWLSSSIRLNYSALGSIDGLDPEIIAPVQTANPDFQGGNRLDALFGLNLIGQSGFVKNQRLAAEFGIPIYQDLNGPQLKVSNLLTLGWQYAF